MKLINLIIISGVVGISSFGCQNSSPTPQANQTPSTPQAYPTFSIPQTEPTLPTPQAAQTPSTPQIYQSSPVPEGYSTFPPPQTAQVPESYPTFPAPQDYQPSLPPQVYQAPPVAQANPTTLQANQTVNNPNQVLKNLPDGDYFYGEIPDVNSAGNKYLIFRKVGNLVTGQEYVFQTDQSNCFRGMAGANGITGVKVAYFELSREGTKWFFDDRDSIKTSDLHRLSFEKAPEFAAKNLQECINIFND